MIPFAGRYRQGTLDQARLGDQRRDAMGAAYNAVDSLFMPNQNGDFQFTQDELRRIYPELGMAMDPTERRDSMANRWLSSTWDRGWRSVSGSKPGVGMGGGLGKLRYSDPGKIKGKTTAFGTGNGSAFGNPKGVFAGRTY